MKTLILVILLLASPAWSQTKSGPKAAPARVDNCAPIGRTADGQLVYSMKCENLPVCRPRRRRRPRPGKRPRRNRRRNAAACSAGPTIAGNSGAAKRSCLGCPGLQWMGINPFDRETNR